VKNEALKEATIYIYGVIGGFDWETWKFINTADTFLEEFKAVEDEADTIHVKINSPGGNVWDGLAIFNALNNSEKTIKTYNDGICYSMAALLMLAGDKSYANANSLFMVHNVISAVWGNAQEMREEADVLDKYDKALGTAIEAKLGVKSKEVLSNYLNYKDNYYTAEEAKNEGFYDVILENKSKNVPEDVEGMSPKDLIEHYAKMNFEPIQEPKKKQNKTPLTMSKVYPKIEATLNKKFDNGQSENGILLTENEADTVEARIDTLENGLQTAQDNAATLQTAADDAETANQTLIDQVNTSLELEGDDQVTTVAGAITALENKITDLGKQPGDTHTRIKNNGEDNEVLPDYVDLNCSIYKLK
tara:strand:+ start:2759 stop:3841 length:1083 start_codon:yes stop_codon:yes gene_type:complete